MWGLVALVCACVLTRPAASCALGSLWNASSSDFIPSAHAGVEVFENSCLVPRGDRLVIVPRSSVTARVVSTASTGFVASDLCAMGHTTKDPAHMLSWYMDESSPSASTANFSHVIFANMCMTKRSDSVVNKRTPVFHNVLLGWFRAALPHGVKELYYEDLAGEKMVRCFDRLVKRYENWRWFRNQKHALEFRRLLLKFYGVDASRVSSTTSITILRRDEDRHFDEEKVAQMLRHYLRDQANVSLVTFDNVRGKGSAPPPSHAKQLQILHDTDILIAAHGAGLAGIIAMKPGATLIELFPHNFRYYMYHELAELLGLHYVPYESPHVWPRRCCAARGDNLPAIDFPSQINGVGARACKKCDVFVPEAIWKALVDQALVAQSLRLDS